MNIASSSARTQSILVVDDAEQVRRTTVAQLGALGYRARGAADGAAALEDVTRGVRISCSAICACQAWMGCGSSARCASPSPICRWS